MKIPPSKRLRFSIFAVIMNFLIFGIGIAFHTDLVSLGSGLLMINSPLYVYILGESYRPSNK